MTAIAIESVLYSLLVGDATVGGLVGTRVYPAIVPQNASLPATTYQQLSGVREHTCAGPQGMASPRFQINCWADTYAEARTLSDAVRVLLDGYSGTVSERTVHVMMLEDEGDMPEVPAGKDVLKRFVKRLDFIIWFKE